jgi:hypothetical protein
MSELEVKTGWEVSEEISSVINDFRKPRYKAIVDSVPIRIKRWVSLESLKARDAELREILSLLALTYDKLPKYWELEFKRWCPKYVFGWNLVDRDYLWAWVHFSDSFVKQRALLLLD